MPSILGLTTAKINGLFDVWVTNSTWDVSRPVNVVITQGGAQESLGIPVPSGTFGEVIPKSGSINWANLQDFSIQIYDRETKSVVVMQANGCNWDKVSGSSDLSQARTLKNISWKGTDPAAF